MTMFIMILQKLNVWAKSGLSQPIRLQYSLIINIYGGNQSILHFLHRDIQGSFLDYLFWLGVANQTQDSFIINISGRN